MPSQSRSRDRHRGSRDQRREYSSSRRPRRNFYDNDRDYDDDDLDDDDDFDHTLNARRYRRENSVRQPPRAQSRDYNSHDYDDREYDNDGGDVYEPALGQRDPRLSSSRSRARESPATSPVKSGRDRDRRRREHRAYDERDDRERRYRGQDEEYRRRRRELDPDAARRHRRRERERERKHESQDSANSGSGLLSADALSRLALQQEEEEEADLGHRSRAQDEIRMEKRRRQKSAFLGGDLQQPREEGPEEELLQDESRARVASGAYLEEGRSPEMQVRHRGGGGPAMERWRKEGSWDGSSHDASASGGGTSFWKKKKFWIFIIILLCLLAIVIPVTVVEVKKKENHSAAGASSDYDTPANSNLDGLSHDSIPEYARGTILDPWTWYDTTDFNVTFTNDTVGGLSIMGLNSTWDDTTRANDNVPPLNEQFPYGQQPIRGVNIGGWLSIEPFIVPSLFESYSSSDNIIDEWTLSEKLGSSASSTIEKHYATFITEQDFIDIQSAGLDHVRIQYSYWAVKTYDGDPYVPQIAWRYLLRAIEYCRKYGLRVKLDLHGLPGSQNGWNHSGHQGSINWLNGTDGELNRQRSLDIHDQLSQFFAQDRYKNIVTLYGLVNEPLMLSLPSADVLNWTTQATELVQKNGITAWVILHDGFLNLDKWDTMYKTDRPDNMFLDTHQYTVFNTGEIVLNHTAKVNLICSSWYSMIQAINSTSTGWGPTMCGEWSQSDTDCAKYVNNVGRGTRWEGTYDTSSTTEYCPTANTGPTCSCSGSNADPADYSDGYKKFLQTYAEAQMSAFETAMGWFYWTWRTESAAQWSYRTAWKNGFMPQKAYSPSFKCGDDIPDFGSLPEYY